MYTAQAAARCHRLGQTRPVQIFRLTNDGTNERGMQARSCCFVVLVFLCACGSLADALLIAGGVMYRLSRRSLFQWLH